MFESYSVYSLYTRISFLFIGILTFSIPIYAQEVKSFNELLSGYKFPVTQQIFSEKEMEQVNSETDICSTSSEDFQTKALNIKNLTGFSNPPGFVNTGLCWWHTKLHRNSIYLTVFNNPESKKPSMKEAFDIVNKIITKAEVVEIPGFKSWYEFSKHYKMEITRLLEKWQLRDTLRLEFVKGLRKRNGTSYKNLNEIKLNIEKYKRIPYVTVIVDFGAHSWLVPGLKNDKLLLIDSNYPDFVGVYSIESNFYSTLASNGYAIGESNQVSPNETMRVDPGYIPTNYIGRANQEVRPIMSLYLDNDGDYLDYINAIKKYCGRSTPFTEYQEEVEKFK